MQTVKVVRSSESEGELFEALSRFERMGKALEDKHAALLEETNRLREQLVLKEREIARSAKMAALGETAAAIAHEVRNPLGAMRLFISLIRRDCEDRPQVLDMLGHLETGVKTLDGVVANILLFSRNRPLAMGVVNFSSILCDQVNSFKLVRPGLKIHIEQDGNPFINGNEAGIRQLIWNLLQNAGDALNGVGEIWVRVEDRRDGQRELQLTVHDSGPGIPEELLPTLFEPFVTSKREGTGLGLAIVKQVAMEHGGEVSVVNEGGAKFVIKFPRGGSK